MPTTVELLTTALSSLSDRDLTQFLGPSFQLWNSWHMQPRPINGTVVLLVKEPPIDPQAAVGRICTISRDGQTDDVYTMAIQLGLFGIYAGWSCEIGETYVMSVN